MYHFLRFPRCFLKVMDSEEAQVVAAEVAAELIQMLLTDGRRPWLFQILDVHTHTLTQRYIYMCVYVCVCVWFYMYIA